MMEKIRYALARLFVSLRESRTQRVALAVGVVNALALFGWNVDPEVLFKIDAVLAAFGLGFQRAATGRTENKVDQLMADGLSPEEPSGGYGFIRPGRDR